MAYNFLSIFKQSFRAANPDLNIEEGFPVSDTMIVPNAAALERIGEIVNDMERRIDYSAMFTDGALERESDFDILRNNLFLGEGLASRGTGVILLEFYALQDTINIDPDLVLRRGDRFFKIAEGNYTLPVDSISGKIIRYAFRAFDTENGGSPVDPGNWEVVEGTLPSGCTRAYSMEATEPGATNASGLTLSAVPMLMSNKAYMNSASILSGLNNSLSRAGVIPDLMTATGYSDEEYESGVIPYEDEENLIKVFRTGGYIDVRLHKGVAEEWFYMESSEPYTKGLYKYKFNCPVYAVNEVMNWIEGDMGSSLPFSFDYVRRELITPHNRIKVNIMTTPSTVWGMAESIITDMKVSAGVIRLLPFYSIRLFADEDCVDGSADAAQANTVLYEYFKQGIFPGAFEFDYLKKLILEATDIKVSKLKYILPDGTRDEFSSGQLSGFTIATGPMNLPVEVPLTALNTIILGGYQGKTGYAVEV